MNRNLDGLRRFYMVFAVALFAVLLGRLAYMQVISWDKYYRASEKNRIRDVILEAPRGLILDRNGEILVDNRPSYAVSVIPYEFLQSDSAVTLLSSILMQNPDALKKKVRKEKRSTSLLFESSAR